MKCRYNKCKLGGEVEKKDAVKVGSMYYHQECYDKKMAKEELRELMGKFPQRDINISLAKAIDESPYQLGFVEYVVKNKFTKFQNAYGLLYQLKIETNYDEYAKQEGSKVSFRINQAIKDMDLNSDTLNFEHKPKKDRFNIY